MSSKRVCLLIFLCLNLSMTLVFAQDIILQPDLVEETPILFDSLHLYESLIIREKISAHIDISKRDVDYLTLFRAKLQIFPQQTLRQQILSQETHPQPFSANESSFHFYFTSPLNTTQSFAVESELRTSRSYVPITQKVDFPLGTIPTEYQKYLQYTDLINTNSQIQAKARELAGDSDDLFEVAHTIAHWVRSHIEYNLSSIVVEASQPATWVFENRKGVCDELTTLYISLLRSLGIPARYVTGNAYTTSDLFDEPWVLHAWAEVYFPEFGWVPFDLTYGQFGFIDATHIEYTTGVDGSTGSTQYQWNSLSRTPPQINISRLQFEHEILNGAKMVESPFEISAELAVTQLGKGSYNALIIQLENTQTHYVSALLSIQRPQNIDFYLPEYAHVLRPFEVKEIVIPFFVTENYLDRYIYTVPIEIFTGYKAQLLQFEVAPIYPQYSQNRINSIVASFQHESPNFEDLAISCSPQHFRVVYETESFIQCDIQNNRLMPVQFEVCFDQFCESAFIPSQSNSTFSYEFIVSELGLHTQNIQLIVNNRKLDTSVRLYGVDIPRLRISKSIDNLVLDSLDEVEAWFYVQKDSFSPGLQTRVQMGSYLPQTMRIGTLSASRNMTFMLNPLQLRPGENEYPIYLWYRDEQGRLHRVDHSITVHLENMNLWQRAMLFFAKLF
ncbi:MAG: transglutaminase-like domain-containing protein [Candidatus Woesearchaeota archaeon]